MKCAACDGRGIVSVPVEGRALMVARNKVCLTCSGTGKA